MIIWNCYNFKTTTYNFFFKNIGYLHSKFTTYKTKHTKYKWDF